LNINVCIVKNILELNKLLSSFNLILNSFNCKTGATGELGTAYTSGAAEYTPGFNVVV